VKLLLADLKHRTPSSQLHRHHALHSQQNISIDPFGKVILRHLVQLLLDVYVERVIAVEILADDV
jgi:hypothetical protein